MLLHAFARLLSLPPHILQGSGRWVISVYFSGLERTLMGRNIIVVGCGRVGSQLANMLSESDNNVCVIDKNSESFANLGGSFNGTTIEGVGFDEDVLLRSGVETTDCVAAVTAHDSVNLMVAEVSSRIFSVPHVITRLYNPGHERTYEQLGLDYVCGTSLVAEEVFAKISSGHGAHVDNFGDFEILRFSLDLKSRNLRQVRVSQLEKGHDIRIVAFERDDGRMSSIPTPDSILHHGDSVLACVRHTRVASFSKWMQEG